MLGIIVILLKLLIHVFIEPVIYISKIIEFIIALISYIIFRYTYIILYSTNLINEICNFIKNGKVKVNKCTKSSKKNKLSNIINTNKNSNTNKHNISNNVVNLLSEFISENKEINEKINYNDLQLQNVLNLFDNGKLKVNNLPDNIVRLYNGKINSDVLPKEFRRTIFLGNNNIIKINNKDNNNWFELTNDSLKKMCIIIDDLDIYSDEIVIELTVNITFSISNINNKYILGLSDDLNTLNPIEGTITEIATDGKYIVAFNFKKSDYTGKTIKWINKVNTDLENLEIILNEAYIRVYDLIENYNGTLVY